MALFDNLGKKLGDVAQNAAKKSSEMVEITKINMSIKSEEDSINKIYNEIGKHCFGKFENGNESDSAIIEFCEKIKNHKANINGYEEKINEIKNIRICEDCGNEIIRTSTFCSKCGAKIENNDIHEADNKEEKDIICPKCNMKVEEDSLFCPGCGTKVKEQ